MPTVLNKRVPLKQLTPGIADECLKLDIYCLLTITTDDDYQPTIHKIIHALHSRGFQSLGDVLNMNDSALNQIKGLGAKSKQYLIELLERASQQSDIILKSPYGISEKYQACN